MHATLSVTKMVPDEKKMTLLNSRGNLKTFVMRGAGASISR